MPNSLSVNYTLNFLEKILCILFFFMTMLKISLKSVFRTEKRMLATEYANRRELILGGALANPADGAVIVLS